MIGAEISTGKTMAPRFADIYAFGRLYVRDKRFYNNLTPRALDEVLKLIAGTSTNALTANNVNLRLLDGPGGTPVGPGWLFGVDLAPSQFQTQRPAPSYAMAWRFEDTSATSYRAAHAELWVGDGSRGESHLLTSGYKFSEVSVTGTVTKAENRPLGLDYALELYSADPAFQAIAMEAILKLVTGQSAALLDQNRMYMRPLSTATTPVAGLDLLPSAAPVPDLDNNLLSRTWDAPAGTLTGRWNQVVVKLLGADGIKRDFWRGGCNPTGGSCGDKYAGDALRWRWALRLREGQTQCPSIKSFGASANTIGGGDSVELSWDVDNADTLTIDQGVGVVTGGRITVRPKRTGTIVYTLTAQKANCPTARATIQVRVIGKPAITSFDANPNPAVCGTSVTVSYTVQGATDITVDQGVGVVSSVGGTFQFTPQQTTPMRMTARNDAGVTIRDLIIECEDVPTIELFGASGCSQAELDKPYESTPGTDTPTSTPQYRIDPGGCFALHWVTNTADATVSVAPAPPGESGSGLAQSGYFRYHPSVKTTYEITVTNSAGTAKKYLTVDVATTPRISIDVSPSAIKVGEKARLRWDSSNADVVNIESDDPNAFGGGVSDNDNAGVSGTHYVSPREEGEYRYEIEAYRSTSPAQRAVDHAVLRVGPGDPARVRVSTRFKDKGTTIRELTVVRGTAVTIQVQIAGAKPALLTDVIVTPDGGQDILVPVTETIAGTLYDGETTVTPTDDETVYRFRVNHPSSLVDYTSATPLTIRTGVKPPCPTIDCSKIRVSDLNPADNNSVTVTIENGVFNGSVGRGYIWHTNTPFGGDGVKFFDIASGSSQAAVEKIENLNAEANEIFVQGRTTGAPDADLISGCALGIFTPVCSFPVSGGDPEIRSFFADPEAARVNQQVELEWDALRADSVTIQKAGPAPGDMFQDIKVNQPATGRTFVTEANAGTKRYRCVPVKGGVEFANLDNNIAVVTYATSVKPTITFRARVNTGTPLESQWQTEQVDLANTTDEVQFQWSAGRNITRLVIESENFREEYSDRAAVAGDTTHVPGRARIYEAIPYNGNIRGDVQAISVNVGSDRPAKITKFSADKSEVSPGGHVRLSWQAQGTTFQLFDVTAGESEVSSPGELNAVGSKSFWPHRDTTYRLVAHGANNTTASREVTVTVVNKPRITFYSDFEATNGSQEVTFRWRVESPDDGGPINALRFIKEGTAGEDITITGTPTTVQGSKTDTPTATTTYTLEARNSDGIETETITITVGGPPGGGGGGGPGGEQQN